MINNLTFLAHVFFISASLLGAAWWSAYALIAFIALQPILSNLFVVKQTIIWGLEVTTTDAYIISSLLGINLLQEFYGRALARQAIGISIASMLFFLVAAWTQCCYVPSAHDIYHPIFVQLLTPLPRIVFASLFSLFVCQCVDYVVYNALRTLWKDRFLVIRNYMTLLTGQLIDTILFTIIGLAGIVANVWTVIAFSYLIKVIVIILQGPVIWASKWLISSTMRKR